MGSDLTLRRSRSQARIAYGTYSQGSFELKISSPGWEGLKHPAYPLRGRAPTVAPGLQTRSDISALTGADEKTTPCAPLPIN
jgi:hypothetical protein